jgi:PleD family two-component response regulator
VALPGARLADAVTVVDTLRELVPEGQTCSAGVAEWDGREPPEALVRRADLALYLAKAGGRDRTEVHGTLPEPAPA